MSGWFGSSVQQLHSRSEIAKGVESCARAQSARHGMESPIPGLEDRTHKCTGKWMCSWNTVNLIRCVYTGKISSRFVRLRTGTKANKNFSEHVATWVLYVFLVLRRFSYKDVGLFHVRCCSSIGHSTRTHKSISKRTTKDLNMKWRTASWRIHIVNCVHSSWSNLSCSFDLLDTSFGSKLLENFHNQQYAECAIHWP